MIVIVRKHTYSFFLISILDLIKWVPFGYDYLVLQVVFKVLDNDQY